MTVMPFMTVTFSSTSFREVKRREISALPCHFEERSDEKSLRFLPSVEMTVFGQNDSLRAKVTITLPMTVAPFMTVTFNITFNNL